MATLSRRRLIFALAAVPAGSQILASPQAEFSSGIKVVSLLVTVRDKSGKFVNQLSQQDFTVFEDGRPQTITYFSRQYDLPLTVGLLVDTSGSQVDVLGDELKASVTFFDQILREDMDQAFLMSFDIRDYLLQSVTSRRSPLEGSLRILYDGLKSRREIDGTVLYDVIFDAAENFMKKYQGRKALVLLTDGEDTASHSSFDHAVEACQRADTVVYAIGLGAGLARGGAVLQSLSEKTGGHFFAVTGKHSAEEIYQTIEEELRSQYNLGYVPPSNAGKNRSGFHKIRVTVDRPGMSVRTREGYYSGG
jgi:VWFA-related protein